MILIMFMIYWSQLLNKVNIFYHVVISTFIYGCKCVLSQRNNKYELHTFNDGVIDWKLAHIKSDGELSPWYLDIINTLVTTIR